MIESWPRRGATGSAANLSTCYFSTCFYQDGCSDYESDRIYMTPVRLFSSFKLCLHAYVYHTANPLSFKLVASRPCLLLYCHPSQWSGLGLICFIPSKLMELLSVMIVSYPLSKASGLYVVLEFWFSIGMYLSDVSFVQVHVIISNSRTTFRSQKRCHRYRRRDVYHMCRECRSTMRDRGKHKRLKLKIRTASRLWAPN